MTFSKDNPLGFHPKWVTPFYMRFGGDFLTLSEAERETLAQELRTVLAEIDSETLSQLLANSNWRPRSVAGYFIGFGRLKAFTDPIGAALLKHPDHASMYCFALVRLDTSKATEHLSNYLREYLQPRYAQDFNVEKLSVHAALAALQFMDEQHQTEYANEFYPDQWNAFAQANLDFIGERSKSLQDQFKYHWSSESLKVTRNFLEALIVFAEQMVD
ncbi:MAG: DUF6000 family protein [Chloroflexota bacterium]